MIGLHQAFYKPDNVGENPDSKEKEKLTPKEKEKFEVIEKGNVLEKKKI